MFVAPSDGTAHASIGHFAVRCQRFGVVGMRSHVLNRTLQATWHTSQYSKVCRRLAQPTRVRYISRLLTCRPVHAQLTFVLTPGHSLHHAVNIATHQHCTGCTAPLHLGLHRPFICRTCPTNSRYENHGHQPSLLVSQRVLHLFQQLRM